VNFPSGVWNGTPTENVYHAFSRLKIDDDDDDIYT
jgi:hypothetical protein